MMLKRHDRGDPVKALQRGLNRLGSMLLIDGDFGESTEAAVVEARGALGLPEGVVADDPLCDGLAQLPEPSAELTAPGVTFIGREEVSSPKAYRQKYIHPVWPSANSGITIGIGYDLKFANRAKLDADWGDALQASAIELLAAVSGTVGSEAKRAQVNDITVPLLAAVKVFLQRMMPEHIGLTRNAYLTLDDDPDSPGGDWCTADTNNTSWTFTFTFDTPASALDTSTDAQVIDYYVRQFDEAQTGEPTVQMTIYDGVACADIHEAGTPTTITAAGYPAKITDTWTAAGISAAADVCVQVTCTKTGGAGGVRNSCDIDAIEWDVTYSAATGTTMVIGERHETLRGVLVFAGR